MRHYIKIRTLTKLALLMLFFKFALVSVIARPLSFQELNDNNRPLEMKTQKTIDFNVTLNFKYQESVWGLYKADKIIVNHDQYIPLDFSLGHQVNNSAIHFILHSARLEAGGKSLLQVVETHIEQNEINNKLQFTFSNNEDIQQIHQGLIDHIAQHYEILRIHPRSFICHKEKRSNSNIYCEATYTAHSLI